MMDTLCFPVLSIWGCKHIGLLTVLKRLKVHLVHDLSSSLNSVSALLAKAADKAALLLILKMSSDYLAFESCKRIKVVPVSKLFHYA